jgi:ATP/maltotriose-dependent transcriptional regulator MalT
MAYYQQAELERLRGNAVAAENGYRDAGRHGYDPMPGLALLHLAGGDADGASAAIRRALQETGDPGRRPALLFAAVDVFSACGDLTGARAAADELAVLAAVSSATMLAAMSAQATGAVLVAEADAAGGLSELRAAATMWQALRMPYHAARVAVVLGTACAALGDRASARLEFDHARATFAELGAHPDLACVAALTPGDPRPAVPGGGLTKREREGLALVAAGRTNREIAAELTVSQHTVGRHVENIFAKLEVTTRAMAIAQAYEQHLL